VFSLAKLCAGIFTAPNLQAGCVTLISVDVRDVKGTNQVDIMTEIRGVLERCIHPAQDVLLPAMNDDERAFFIVACADANGFEVIASRIGRELREFDTASQLGPIISSTTLLVATGASREEQASELAVRIKQLIQGHLLGKEKIK
jgi:hypothetical protein